MKEKAHKNSDIGSDEIPKQRRDESWLYSMTMSMRFKNISPKRYPIIIYHTKFTEYRIWREKWG